MGLLLFFSLVNFCQLPILHNEVEDALLPTMYYVDMNRFMFIGVEKKMNPKYSKILGILLSFMAAANIHNIF